MEKYYYIDHDEKYYFKCRFESRYSCKSPELVAEDAAREFLEQTNWYNDGRKVKFEILNDEQVSIGLFEIEYKPTFHVERIFVRPSDVTKNMKDEQLIEELEKRGYKVEKDEQRKDDHERD